MTVNSAMGSVESVERSQRAAELGRSVLVWLGLMAFVVLVKLIITTVMPALFRDPSQAAVFAWPALAILTVAGLAGMWFSHQTGFPGGLSSRVTPRQRYLLPILLGIALGVLYVVFDLATGYTAAMVALRGQPSMNIDFPANALIYPAGTIIVEVIYRLVPIPLLLWLLSRVLLRGRAETAIFWVLALLTSAIEPLTQDLGDAALGPATLAIILALDYGVNLGQAAFFRKYGFLAAILVRVAFYLVWHAAYVH